MRSTASPSERSSGETTAAILRPCTTTVRPSVTEPAATSTTATFSIAVPEANSWGGGPQAVHSTADTNAQNPTLFFIKTNLLQRQTLRQGRRAPRAAHRSNLRERLARGKLIAGRPSTRHPSPATDMPTPDQPARPALKRAVGKVQFFTVAFGTIIGVGWMVYLGYWLEPAGPVGASIGFAAGTLLIALISICYAEMASMFPVSGGELAYTYESFGTGTSFITAWTLAFIYTAVAGWEGIAIGVLAESLFPGFGGPVWYTLFDVPVRPGKLALGLGVMAVLVWMNIRGIAKATRFQDLMTYGFLALCAVFIGAAFIFGDTANLEPAILRSEGGSIMPGIIAAFVTAPFFLAGFDVVPQLMEERAPGTTGRAAALMLVLAVLGAGAFYVLIIMSGSMIVPWQQLLEYDQLPAATAFQETFSSPFFSRAVLAAGFIGILTTWNAVIIAASRVFFAMSRARMLPTFLGSVHAGHGTPSGALLFVGGLGALGVVLGEGAIAPIVSAATICFGIIFALVSIGVVKLRVTRPDARRPYRVPGGIVTAIGSALAATLFVVLALGDPYEPGEGIPVAWMVIIACFLLGVLFWLSSGRLRKSVTEPQRRELILGEEAPSE
ncbi:MAG: APC family permease [Gemmatimonadetes bacterium]|nr:APC family permease [Gemmatimonadota bacterium]MYG21692.1 APC family permease [Gemmatimonadota bacterium]MYJ40215.1 APC family permease [Gemmatimonadota bacterium]